MVLKEKYGPWAIVTGASAGLGDQFSRQLAAEGFNLVLVARRAERLEALATEIVDHHHVQVKVLSLDLCALGAVEALYEGTSGYDVGLFVDNAGFGYMGVMLDQDPERIGRMIHLNCTVTLMAALRFARRFKERGRGGIIVSASLAGFQATPYMTAYGATKGFDLLFAEGLAEELRGTGVDVLALCPGTTHTEFGQVAGSKGPPPESGMKPGPVVTEALRALGHKNVVVTGWTNKVVGHWLGRLFPRSFVTRMSGKTIRRIAIP